MHFYPYSQLNFDAIKFAAWEEITLLAILCSVPALFLLSYLFHLCFSWTPSEKIKKLDELIFLTCSGISFGLLALLLPLGLLFAGAEIVGWGVSVLIILSMIVFSILIFMNGIRFADFVCATDRPFLKMKAWGLGALSFLSVVGLIAIPIWLITNAAQASTGC